MIAGLRPSDIPHEIRTMAFRRAVERRCAVQIWRAKNYFPGRKYFFTLEWNHYDRPEFAGCVYPVLD